MKILGDQTGPITEMLSAFYSTQGFEKLDALHTPEPFGHYQHVANLHYV